MEHKFYNLELSQERKGKIKVDLKLNKFDFEGADEGLIPEQVWKTWDGQITDGVKAGSNMYRWLTDLGLIENSSQDTIISLKATRDNDERSHQSLYGELGERNAGDIKTNGVTIPQIVTHDKITPRRRRIFGSVYNASLFAQSLADGIEDIIFNGSTINVGGNRAYGFKDVPSLSSTALQNWNTPANAVDDIIGSINTLENAGFDRPKAVIMGSARYGVLSQDINSDKTVTLNERLSKEQRLADVGGRKAIFSSSKLSSNQIVVFEADKRNVDYFQILRPTPFLREGEWEVLIGATSIGAMRFAKNGNTYGVVRRA